MPCYCGSTDDFSKCCQPYHLGEAAPSPETLMRSRFSAFATANATYIMQTQVNSLNQGLEAESFTKDLQTQKWIKLEILTAKSDSVAFKASMLYNNKLYTLQENSLFEQEHGRWLYSQALLHEDSQREVKRNEACPCGSNKKYKQCCQKV